MPQPLDDADVDATTTVAVQAKFRNAGQVCTSPSRFFVARPVLDAFEDAVLRRTGALVVGNGRDPGVDMGPLATDRQRVRTERLVADALAKGARLVCGGRRPPALERGYFHEPTILADVPADALILHEEPFAPVMAIVPVADAREAVARANASEAGLASYLFTRSPRLAEEISGALEAGLVGVNTAVVATPEGPFGGASRAASAARAARSACANISSRSSCTGVMRDPAGPPQGRTSPGGRQDAGQSGERAVTARAARRRAIAAPDAIATRAA